MSKLNIHLFGKLRIRRDENPLHDSIVGKPVEIFCYVLLNRHAPVMRESLADLLWDDLQSKRHLRQTLCALKKKLYAGHTNFPELLVIKNDSVRLNLQADFWLDVAAFEEAFQSVARISGKALNGQQAQVLQQATDLYRGDLLEGWYQDWCLYERERLRDIYITMLLKLMNWCEAQKQYEQGVYYGEKVLRYDQANERTHRALMLLRYLDGDRTGALRQYDRCVEALSNDLQVAPASPTITLCEKIRADQVITSPPGSIQLPTPQTPTIAHLQERLNQFDNLLTAMTQLEQELRYDIKLLEVQQNNQTPSEQDENERKDRKKCEC